MNPGPILGGLSLARVLGGLGKTLSIANQVIPLYRQAKPLIANARTAFSVLKELQQPKSNQQAKKPTSPSQNNNLNQIKYIPNHINSPQFFQ